MVIKKYEENVGMNKRYSFSNSRIESAQQPVITKQGQRKFTKSRSILLILQD